MGVQIYLLERKLVSLSVGGLEQAIGTLRRSWKVTELDQERASEIDNAKAFVQRKAAPVAVMLADVTDLTLVGAGNGKRHVAAHLVLGWDLDRPSVTDFNWDYLPVLGYAVREDASAPYVLHEVRDEGLSPITRDRAVELGIHNEAGDFVRRGQPKIVECKTVRPFITGYAEAECTLSDGRSAQILTSIDSTLLPENAWYVGRRPSDVARYTR